MVSGKARGRTASNAQAPNNMKGGNGAGTQGLDTVLQSLSQFIDDQRDGFPRGFARLRLVIEMPGGGSVRLELDGPIEPGTRQSYDLTTTDVLKSALPLSYKEVTDFVVANNKSTNTAVTTQLLMSLIWKESGFRPDAKAATSTATGLMQMTVGAVSDVNKNSPQGVHFEHSEMSDPARNIQCGTYYLDLRIKRAGGKLKEGLESYGTGVGYADDIIECEACLKKGTSPQQDCLDQVHA